MILTLPWSHLCRDNRHLMPIRMGKFARLALTPEYREAKALATAELTAQWRGDPKLDGVLAIVGTLYFPNARKCDAANYRKLITDVLTGIAYADDSQLHRETWQFGGIDRTSPRAEIELVVLEGVDSPAAQLDLTASLA